MDNAAFTDAGEVSQAAAGQELASILRDLAKDIENGSTEQALRDSNGNRVGTFKITGGGQWKGES